MDDAAGEAFDKTAQLLDLPYPGGPAVSALAEKGTPGAIELARPMIHAPNLSMSFSGLKTSVLTAVRSAPDPKDEQFRADLARGCTDNGAMIAAAGIARMESMTEAERKALIEKISFGVRPRWPLEMLPKAALPERLTV